MGCPVCCKEIQYAGESQKCTGCSAKYHYACLNMTSAYYLEHHFELKKCWRCSDCANITHRLKNDTTPIRTLKVSSLNDTTMSIDDDAQEGHNINITTNAECKTSDQSIQFITKRQAITTEGSSITLETFSKLLDSKLEKNNHSLLSVLKNTIQNEIQKTIIELREDILQDTHKLKHEQDIARNNINTLNEKIVTLQLQNNQLKQQITEIKQTITEIDKQKQENNLKKIVLFGLTEYDQESEYQLHYRIIEAFKDILNVDLTGYIEGLSRIGRSSNSRRPIIIELISKRMTKYILDNATYFKHTGLFISEYLNETALRQKKALQENLRLARQQGHHAIIRNNKLIIDGRQQELTTMTKQTYARKNINFDQTIESHKNDNTNDNINNTNKRNTDLLQANIDEISSFRH